MIKGIGCDIAEISRIEKAMQNTRFTDKVYTQYEQTWINNRSVHTAAGIWAAKEAVSKALGTGFAGFTVKDIEIQHDNNGKPFVILHDGAEIVSSKRCIKKIHISISHEDEYAMAFAIAE